MSDSLADTELIKRCLLDNDKQAWDALVRKYSKLIWGTIHKTFHTYSFRYTDEDTEDMYGALFLSLIENDFKKLRQFRRENACSLSTWLTIITARMTIDFMRKDKGRYMAQPSREDDDIWETIPDAKYRADKIMEERQTAKNFHKAVSALSPGDGMIYDLLYRQGFSPEETARTLGLTVSAVYTRKHRIIGKIRKDIKDM